MQNRKEDSSSNVNNFGMFGTPPLAKGIHSAAQLEQMLASPVGFIVAYKPYLEQLNLNHVFAKDNPDAEQILKTYLEKCDVNVSNNLGMTLLHTLMWAQRPDLAKMVLESPTFTKINYKFCIPFDMAVMYASALDLAITMWLAKDTAFDLDFLKTMLSHGALPPLPDKKFLNGEFTNTFYPLIVSPDADAKSPDELIGLFSLLHQYDFSIADMEKEFNRRLFDTTDSFNNRAKEYCDNTGMSIEEQKSKLDAFMAKLNGAVKDLEKGSLAVKLSDAQKDNGKDTLALPFDAFDRPCCVM